MSKKANVKTARFSDADWYQPGIEVVLGGAGGIGSWACFYLSRMEANIYVYDFDTIDETNMAGQLYPISSIGKNKAEAIAEVCRDFSGNTNIECLGKFEEGSMVAPFTFSAFDNMSARKTMFDAWCKLEDKELFVDGRMLAEQGIIYFVTPAKIEDYLKTLFSDDEVVEQPCSMKATSHCGAMIASYMVSGYNNYIANKKLGFEAREVPFMYSYELQLLNTDLVR